MVRFRLIGCLLVFGLGLFGVASCSSPDLELDGLACSSAGECAEGFVCRPSTQTCVPEGSDIGDGGDGEPCTTDVDEDGLCAEDDCDDSDATCDAAGCVDADSDGTPACQDPCDDPDDECQTCEDSDNDGVCVDDDCDDTVPSCTNDCTTDLDADSQRDCDDTCVDVDGDGLGRGNLDNAGCGEGLMMTDSDDDVATECADSDSDGCDDCGVNSQFTPLDDGADGDSDGLCDVGDGCNDVDGDGLGDGTNGNADCAVTQDDSNPLIAMLCADTDGDGCDDCSQTSEFNPGNDGTDADSDGICAAGDCNDVAGRGEDCGTGSCSECPPRSITLTSPETGPVCPDSVEFMLDADGVQFAESEIACVGDRTTVSFADFDVGDFDSFGVFGEWATSTNGDLGAEKGDWPDNFDVNSCPGDGSFIRFVEGEDNRSLFYNGEFDASGLVELRLSFVAASRGGVSNIGIRGCCNDEGRCDAAEFEDIRSGIEIADETCDVLGNTGLPPALFDCSTLRIIITRRASTQSVLALDDLTILGSPAVNGFSEVGAGDYTFDIQACVPGDYSVTCTYDDNGVPELTSSSSVTLEDGG